MSTMNRISTVVHMCEQTSSLCDQEQLFKKENQPELHKDSK